MTASRTLIEQLSGHVKHGDHLCVICESYQDQMDAVAQYIADGIQQNEFVMYAADPDTTAALRAQLTQYGVDADAETARGALMLPTAEEAYLHDGQFDADAMYRIFETAINDALAAGYSGCRFAGEPTWAIDRQELRPGLIEFENKLNGLFRDKKAAGLCVYNKNTWPAEIVRDVLRTHPVAVVDDRVCAPNIYFERRNLLEEPGAAHNQVEWMLNQLREHGRQETRLELALEAGRLGNWELDLRTDTSVRSLRHDQIFGYDTPLPHWGYELFMQHVLPEDRYSVESAFNRSLQEGATWQFECRIRQKTNGPVRWIEAYGRPLPEGAKADQIECLLGIVADITERKAMEQALREADRRKDEFLATLAHELRNPLAPILNALHTMDQKQDVNNEWVHGIIDRQARHLARLVDDLLDVSRITTGHIELRKEVVELRSVLASAIEASQPLIDAARHTLDVTMPDHTIFLEGDATRLAQVFLNIINNAAKYTPEGGRIRVTATQEGGEIVVTIADSGMGISAELMPHIFTMFVQGGKAGERAQGGLGVGLALAKQLLELHKGTLTAKSAGPGFGTEFTVRLPVADRASVAAISPIDHATEIGAGKRILIVDDNLDAADSLSSHLQLLGYRTQTCYDGCSAIEAAVTFKPQVAILDIGLPDLDGYQVARRLRAILPAVRLVALTGWGQDKDRQLAYEAGFDLHRTKPADPAEFLAVINALCKDESEVNAAES